MFVGISNDPLKYTWQKIHTHEKKLEVYGAGRHKTYFYSFFLSTDDTIIGLKG